MFVFPRSKMAIRRNMIAPLRTLCLLKYLPCCNFDLVKHNTLVYNKLQSPNLKLLKQMSPQRTSIKPKVSEIQLDPIQTFEQSYIAFYKETEEKIVCGTNLTLETFLTMNDKSQQNDKYPLETFHLHIYLLCHSDFPYKMYIRKKLVNGQLMVIYNILENQLIVTCKVHLSFLEDSLPCYLYPQVLYIARTILSELF